MKAGGEAEITEERCPKAIKEKLNSKNDGRNSVDQQGSKGDPEHQVKTAGKTKEGTWHTETSNPPLQCSMRGKVKRRCQHPLPEQQDSGIFPGPHRP